MGKAGEQTQPSTLRSGNAAGSIGWKYCTVGLFYERFHTQCHHMVSSWSWSLHKLKLVRGNLYGEFNTRRYTLVHDLCFV